MKVTKLLALQYLRIKLKVLALVSPNKTAEIAFKLFCTPLDKSKKQTPSIFKQAESLYDSFNGKKLKGYRWNKGKDNKVLIIHGFASAAHKFNKYIIPLVEKEYEVIAFDAPAHGSSEGETINAVEYAAMIEFVVNKYGPITNFITHSFGSLALCLAMENIKHDEKTRMVLIAPATETTSAINNAFKQLQIENRKVRTAFDNIIYKVSGHQPDWFSIKRAIQNIRTSVLWLHDRDDTVTPYRDARAVKKMELQNVTFFITQGLGHRRIYHDEEVKNKVFNFLK